MKTLTEVLSRFAAKDVIALAIGVVLGISLILFIRSRQMWSSRRAFGYDVYTAITLRQRLGRWAALGLVALLILIGVYGWWAVSRPAGLSGVESMATIEGSDRLPEVRIVIPELAVETTMIEAPFVAQQWDISRLRGEVAHLAGTAYPGDPGNSVLAGHITIPGAGWGPFRELDTLKEGDRIFIERGDETFVYEVTTVMVVEPTDVQVAFPTQDNRLTLITCTGWSDIVQDYTQRVVVVAQRVE